MNEELTPEEQIKVIENFVKEINIFLIEGFKKPIIDMLDAFYNWVENSLEEYKDKLKKG